MIAVMLGALLAKAGSTSHGNASHEQNTLDSRIMM